mmetsp:Transcript_34192/g.82890  ORF Transcript_34192/g.82890 Transcript_34192/m.82890 type:complete len:375 (+) Transcript_34192:236-1360(+)
MMTSIPSSSSLLMAVMLCANSVNYTSAWIVSSTEASVAATTADKNNELRSMMYVEEAPTTNTANPFQKLPFLFHDLEDIKMPFRNIFLRPPLTPPPPETLSSSSEASSSSWSHSIQDDSIPCTYKPIWDWQTEYFQDHLTNFEEMELPDPSLAVVQSEGTKATRVRTKWYSSKEYRLIRMTYMDGGDMTQIFTTVCYPRKNLPILGHGLLQVGDRRITISDFQPLEETHLQYADQYLQPIKDQYPSLGQEMSERFFQKGEFWSDCTLLGRFSKSSNDNDEQDMWNDLWPAYKACVQTHVQLCQEQETTAPPQDDTILLQKHAEYDAHVASRDPAIKMLTGIFGEETATKVVYEALFPLANPPDADADAQQQQQQ